MRVFASQRWRGSRFAVVVVLSSLAWCQPQTASAWHGHWRGGWGYRPWCGPAFGPGFSGFYGPRFYGGWGGWYGGTRFAFTDSVFLGGAGGGFFSGTLRGYTTFGGPGWCGPVWGGYGWPACYPAYSPCVYPFGYGWGWNPIVVPSPFIRWVDPVCGPRPVMPWLGFGFADAAPAARPAALAEPQQMLAAARPAAAPPAPQLAARQPARAVAVRSSNGLARLRAGRLVAIGDRHLKTAVNDPTKLPAALDAYRRAATIAPDLPDTYLRQAVVLTALDRGDDATRAIDRAIAIDARLGSDPAAALAAHEQLPPDPVFGERPDAGPTSLESRGRELLARIFADPAAARANVAAAAPAGLNWIADRWTRLHGDQAGGLRADAVAAK